MKREIIKTADGSATIFLPEWNEHYHSKHGAIQEALHVFIHTGLDHIVEKNQSNQVDILEIGFGTGLNAILSFYEAKRRGITIHYTGVEAYPIKPAEWQALRYAEDFPEPDAENIFSELHGSPWNEKSVIAPFFHLEKQQQFFSEISAEKAFDLVFFDAFGPRVQPELWEEEILTKMYRALRPSGVFVTYSAKGSVRRTLQKVGFIVERLPGPPGKREMLRATRSEC